MMSVLFPYRGDDGPRDVLFGWVLRWWQHHFPEAEICVGRNFDSGFNRSKARNDAFAQSTGAILCVADADTVPTAEGVRAAIAEVVATKCWSIPYAEERYYNLCETITQEILQLPSSTPPVEPVYGEYDHKITSWAGCLVLPREAWETVGGYDERFVGWAFEDNAVMLALDTLWGPHRRQGSYVVHLWHPRFDLDFDHPYIEHNKQLFSQYRNAQGNTALMTDMVNGR